MKITLLPFLFLPMVAFAQKSTEPYLHHHNADRIVAFFLGNDVFDRHVKFDTKKSKYSTPNAFFFQYNFSHPKFSGETLVVSFTLDSAGQFIPGKGTHGLIRIASSNVSTWISARQALAICRDEGHRIKKRSLQLSWDSTNLSYDIFQKTDDFRDIVPGEAVWKVKGEVLFRGERYSGTFEVNVFTGRITRRFSIPWD